MNLSKEEVKYLISHLSGERTWYSGMGDANPSIEIFRERLSHIESILKKLKLESLKLKLDKQPIENEKTDS